MILLEVAEMLAASGYPYTIQIDEGVQEGEVGRVYNVDDPDNSVGEVIVTPTGDYLVRIEGKKDVVFVKPIDVIMWIVQML